MIILSAIDIKGGHCVRLSQGKEDQETKYFDDPVEVAKMWVSQGAKYLHIIDLDGAFGDSDVNFDIIKNIVKDFESTNTKAKYKSDLEVFIRESKLEDFFNENGETIFVSTIHKAKGKEFDNVFLILENVNTTTDEAKRQLYVAMTRAKQNLTILHNSNLFEHYRAEGLEYIENGDTHQPPAELAMHLSFKDVWLDYFIGRQNAVEQLISGDDLTLHDNVCRDKSGRTVLKFSKQFTRQLEIMKAKNYRLKSAKVNFIVYWTKDEIGEEIKIVLPELYFERNDGNNFNLSELK